jgi:hypothetical protein
VVQAELRQAQEVFPGCGAGLQIESPLNDGLRLSQFLLLAKNHAHPELRRRIPASGQVDGDLKSLLGFYRNT